MENVLIVDDVQEYVETLEVYLEDRFNVLKALTFKEAKLLLENTHVQLAIIDIRLDEDNPDNKDGIELLKQLKDKAPDTAVIVMSAYKEFDCAVEALNAGADFFMRKPINPEQLDTTINKLL